MTFRSMRFLFAIFCLLAAVSHSYGQDPSPIETARQDRERFELRVNSAIAAAENRYFSLKASLELDLADTQMDAQNLASALFHEDLQDFRARPKVESFLMFMIEDLEKFIGRPPDPLRLQMLDELQKALIQELDRTRHSEEYIRSDRRQFYSAIGASGGLVASTHLAILFIYISWKKLIRPAPQNFIALKNFLKRNSMRAYWNFKLWRAKKKNALDRIQTCQERLAQIPPSKKLRFPRPSRNRVWRFLGRFSFWAGIDAAIASGLAWGSHHFFYAPLQYWDAQEDFVTEKFDEFVLEQKRSYSPNQKASDKRNP